MIENNNLAYDNNYRSEHSLFLQDKFNIFNRGVDYYNPFNLSFEFKECNSKKPKNQWYKVYEKQLRESKYHIFCLNNKEFYVHKSRFLLSKYSFKTYGNRANIRINTIRKNYLYKTDNLNDLKKFVDNMRE